MKDAFDMLYAEGARSPKMMSVGIHCRLAGRPSRAADTRALPRLRGVQAQGLGRDPAQIAEHWMKVHPAAALT